MLNKRCLQFTWNSEYHLFILLKINLNEQNGFVCIGGTAIFHQIYWNELKLNTIAFFMSLIIIWVDLLKKKKIISLSLFKTKNTIETVITFWSKRVINQKSRVCYGVPCEVVHLQWHYIFWVIHPTFVRVYIHLYTYENIDIWCVHILLVNNVSWVTQFSSPTEKYNL